MRRQAPRPARRLLSEWIKEQRQNRPPTGSCSIHFYDLAASLNDSDISGLEACTILRVDIDPFQSTGLGAEVSRIVRIPPGAGEREIQAASKSHVPLITLSGPTGVGKSFITGSFIERTSPKNKWPVIAKQGAHVPTSAHVCLHRGSLHPGTQEPKPVLLFDFEGEDGRLRKNLFEKGMRRLQSLRVLGMSEGAMRGQMNTTIATRQKIVKELLPQLAYLLSDVVIFIDTVEPRRTERMERIRRFAGTAHTAVESLGWRPALLLIQNKWTRGEGEEAIFDITSEYDWLLEGLQDTFSSIIVLRVPAATDKHAFADSLHAMHMAIERSVQLVRRQREKAGCLFNEVEFWFAYQPMVEQFSQRDPSDRVAGLDVVVSGQRTSQVAASNALKALSKLGPLPGNAETFHARVGQVLDWYAYARAGEARIQGEDAVRSMRDGLRAVYDTILGTCLKSEPCCAVLTHDGSPYTCTQRRAGHLETHNNPAMIRIQSQNLLKRMVFWKDAQPCKWATQPPGFQSDIGSTARSTYQTFLACFDEYVAMEIGDYQIACKVEKRWATKDVETANTTHDDLCLLCLRVGSRLVVLPNGMCRHRICLQCVLTRKALSKSDNMVVCPFCHSQSVLVTRSSDSSAFRLLSLDGGGVRGLIELLVLQAIEKRFAPLRVISLFDLIVGTSVGGIISMGLLAKLPLERLDSFLVDFAARVLDVSALTKLFQRLCGLPSCDSHLFRAAVTDLFSKGGETDDIDDLKSNDPPYAFCTTFQLESHETQLFCNYPLNWKLSATRNRHSCSLDWAACATSAAPTFFPPSYLFSRDLELCSKGCETFVDGGVKANCPAKQAVELAVAIQLLDNAIDSGFVESLVSIGTGLEAPSALQPEANVLTWVGNLIQFATDSEKMWARDILEDREMQDVPKLRINPPELGSLDPFSSASIPKIRAGMTGYFASATGKRAMDKLFNLTYAKLWQVKQDMAIVSGQRSNPIHIILRDLRCDFGEVEKKQLRQIIVDRGKAIPWIGLTLESVTALRSGSTVRLCCFQTEAALNGQSGVVDAFVAASGCARVTLSGGGQRDVLIDNLEVEEDEAERLRELAKQAVEQQPVVPPMVGRFVYTFDGVDYVLGEGEREFTLIGGEPGYPFLNVVWRSDESGDIPISGFPHSVSVLPPVSNKRKAS